MSTRELRCPACDAPMQQVERRGILIDICRDCKGVFLDRGELDKLSEVSNQPDQAPLADEAERLSRRDRPRYSDDRDDDYRDEYGRGTRRRRGWLEDVFDLD